jgi:hypothetical protein
MAAPLQGEGGDLFGDVLDLHVEAGRRVRQPDQLAFLAAQAEVLIAKAEQGAVVEHVAGIVAPDRIGDAARLQLAHVASQEPVQIALGVRAADAVFHHRREVEQGGGVAHGEVFQLDLAVAVGHVESGPAAPVVVVTQRRSALVERRRLERRFIVGQGAHAAASRWIT